MSLAAIASAAAAAAAPAAADAPSGAGVYFVNDAGSGPAANSLQLLH